MRVNGQDILELDLPGYTPEEANRRKQFERSLSIERKLSIICAISEEASLRRQKQVRDRMAETGMTREDAIRSFREEWKDNPSA